MVESPTPLRVKVQLYTLAVYSIHACRNKACLLSVKVVLAMVGPALWKAMDTKPVTRACCDVTVAVDTVRTTPVLAVRVPFRTTGRLRVPDRIIREPRTSILAAEVTNSTTVPASMSSVPLGPTTTGCVRTMGDPSAAGDQVTELSMATSAVAGLTKRNAATRRRRTGDGRRLVIRDTFTA
jgi:hypothetical protein